MNLVIVESPTKAKKILEILLDLYPAETWKVEATAGAFKDLPEKELGINLETFELEWISSKRNVVILLNKEAKFCDKIFIATDPDREGEGIAQHVFDLVKKHIAKDKIFRIVFQEITEDALKQAIEQPKKIDQGLVQAQNARRAIDRICGYMLSPLLWKQVGNGLTAGRVQSCVLEELVKHTRARRNFKSQDKFYVEATLEDGNIASSDYLDSKPEAEAFLALLKASSLQVHYAETKQEVKPPAGLKTSEFLILATSKLKITSQYAMQLAQTLFSQGHISYHRTDSTSLNQNAATSLRNMAVALAGESFASKKVRMFSKGGAHESLRPTRAESSPSKLKSQLNEDQYRVYQLIWARALATQGVAAVNVNQSAEFKINDTLVLEAKGSYLSFEGWHKVSGFLFRNPARKLDQTRLKPVKFALRTIATAPVNRHTESTLIQWMDRAKIGRPSTYAYVLNHLTSQNYVARTKDAGFESVYRGEFIITYLNLLNNKLIDPSFTSDLEENLDLIAEGNKTYKEVVKAYYNFLQPLILDGKKLRLTTAEMDSAGEKLVVCLDKKSEPYLWNAKSKEWFWLDFDEQNSIVKWKDKPLSESCKYCQDSSNMVLTFGQYGKFVVCKACGKNKGISE